MEAAPSAPFPTFDEELAAIGAPITRLEKALDGAEAMLERNLVLVQRRPA
ncbi:hypothetical protein [Paracoccus tibetensis]|nr:hypothetical protein [Paracoccus tibetensis]